MRTERINSGRAASTQNGAGPRPMLDSLAWSMATPQERARFIDMVGVADIEITLNAIKPTWGPNRREYRRFSHTWKSRRRDPDSNLRVAETASNCRVRTEGALPPHASRDTANFDLVVLRRATLWSGLFSPEPAPRSRGKPPCSPACMVAWALTSVVRRSAPASAALHGQPENVGVLRDYGLFVDKPGDFVKKPMSACTGREIMTEVLAICVSRRRRKGSWRPPSAFPA